MGSAILQMFEGTVAAQHDVGRVEFKEPWS